MKCRLLVVLPLLLSPVMAFAQSATCTHLDFAEIKAMKRNDLEMAYCDATFNIKKARIQGKLASNLEGINQQRAGGSDQDLATMRNERMGERADSDEHGCLDERERLGRALLARKINMQKIDQECPLAD